MKVLFIGGTGIISSACTQRALTKGIDLYHLNRGTSARPTPDGVTVLRGDIRDKASAQAALGDHHFDAVVEWIAFTPDHIETDIELFSGRTRQYVFISSASAYHTPPLDLPLIESTPLHNPYWQYSRDKIACEERLLREYRGRGFPVTIVRPSHTYDRTLMPMGFKYTMIDRMRKGKKVIVHGDGTSLWTLTHHQDFAVGLVGLLGAVGRLLCAGLSLDPAPLFAGRDVRVGDLSQPATLLRLEPVSRHAWMLNGSRARRASDPVPTTVGVTLEVAQARASAAAAEAAAVTTTVAPALAPSAPAAPAAQVAATALAASASSFATQTVPPRSRPAARQISNPSYRRGRPMDERRPGAGIADPTVMSDYFDTMRQFLETQERVMASYLGSDLAAAAPRPALRPRSVPLTLPRAAEVMVPSVPVAAVALAHARELDGRRRVRRA